MLKYFVIKKLIKADSAQDAIKREKLYPVADCWEDTNGIESETEKKGNVGFRCDEHQ